MSQKSSVPQAISFVSQVLKRDRRRPLVSSPPALERLFIAYAVAGLCDPPDQKLSVAAPALIRSCITLAPVMITPSRRSSSP